MKEHFLELIDQIGELEKLFHATPSSPGLAIPNVDEIFDVQECQIWLQAVILEVQDIVDRTSDSYAKDTLDILSRGHNGWNDRRDFDEIKGRLFAMKSQVDKYYAARTDAEEVANKQPKIFISHSSKDKDYVALIVSLLDDMGLQPGQIFCSSLPGYDIPIDTNIFDHLRSQFSEFNLHVMIIHSENYYQSAVSLNEMGAAWVLRSSCTSFLLPGFCFAQMTGVVNGRSIAIKLDNDENEVKDKLNQLYDTIANEFSVAKKPNIIWEQKRNSFITAVKGVATEREMNREPVETDTTQVTNDDVELLESGVYVRPSEKANGKNIYYCPACYTKERKLYPIVPGSLARDKFCSNCKTHYTKF